MGKDKNYNPVQAHHKAEKAKAVKKGKAEVQHKRNEKLARRNPFRIQREIDGLERLASSGATLSKHDEQRLEALRQDLRAVKKARDALGDKAPTFGRDGSRGGGSVLGKRWRDGNDSTTEDEDEDVPDDVRSIPMPRDTPPPMPKEILDKWWARRRARRNAQREREVGGGSGSADVGAQVFVESGVGSGGRTPRAPTTEPQTVYSSQPVLRDLRKEAAVFMPASVRSRMTDAAPSSASQRPIAKAVQMEDVEEEEEQ